MEDSHDDYDGSDDGSDIFWPGYVDAVTNLVLNLLFLLTVMIVAVFMFALELGRSTHSEADKTKPVSAKGEAKAAASVLSDPVKENIALKQENQLLKLKLSQLSPQKTQPIKGAEPVKTLDATGSAPKPVNRLDKAVVSSDTDILVRFVDEAVALKPAEHDRLREILKPVVAKGKAIIFVEVPTGFSEAKRMGFYRAMAVRSLLIEMKMPKENIDLSVKEGSINANASLVRVKSR